MAHTDMNRVVSEPVTQVTEAKPERVTLVELRNGKLVFKQKPMSFEKLSETMQEIVKFREMLEQRIQANSGSLAGIPDDHKPLIAKLVHESDKGLQALSRHIQQELLPAQDEDDEEACKTVAQALPLDAVEKTVKSVASRQNYGLDSLNSGGKVPAAWQVWRWEVKDEYRCWLPKAAQEKVQARFLERQQAKQDVLGLFQTLSESEQRSIVGTKAPAKTAVVPGRDMTGPIPVGSAHVVIDADNTVHGVTAQLPLVNANAEQQVEHGGSPDKKGPGRPKKAADPEKAAKEKEREARKHAKAEKEKKEKDAFNKSKNMFASFFVKPKASGSSSRQSSIPKDDISMPASPSPSKQVPDFAKTFRPFTLKRGAELAPINWFHEAKQRNNKAKCSETVPHRVEGNVIIIEDDDESMNLRHNDGDVEMQDLTTTQPKLDLGQMTAAERLQDVLSTMPRTRLPNPPRKRPHREFKSYHPYPIRTILTQMNEAEIAGDDEAVRRLLALLRDRSVIPAKVLIFSEDARPGYFGTWTRNSREVGPRTPFARDVVAIDYSYDSGEEWEEEPGEADDVLEGEEEEDNGEEADSDLDSWLVDDDDVADPGTPIEERAGSPDFFDVDLPPPPPKRKTNDNEAKITKKRKVVVPLVPFSKGPCWENVIDTPFPINPFTFVSAPEEKSQTQATPHNAHTTSNVVFAVPALPSHVTASYSQPASLTASTASVPKRTAPPPRTVFPDQHIPLLLSKIASLETGNLTYLVETVHKELTEFKVKKNSIEAKIKEIGEKSREGKKVWVVKPEVKAVYGIA
ncbi:hypothetical protein EIP86_002293 [Pleurotus ostreatoroseus]|nr:hypothetical protein EIP86_002293 [Pleurotus ostreatoroseus]